MSSDLSLVWLFPAWNGQVILCLQGKDEGRGVFPMNLTVEIFSLFAILCYWDDETSSYIPAPDQLRP